MRLQFELDPQIIHHIIYSQAGSIGKALIELLMNSVDASATLARLVITKEGFSCLDDGKGFATRQDVRRYFGRFGTPHEEGDATYGRFRLGRGQIMAHATTVWKSNRWQMTVDTRTMGYGYDLDPLKKRVAGCDISGTWYEPLTETELMSTVQEVRDLVKYTPIAIELNGRVITRDPKKEKWDFEDDFAYYRAKEDGAVSIYNQGVLVRHDPTHIWGAGGMIVSKRAIGLNVSRTEILRKSCPVWKVVAREFGRLADEVAARLGEHRKTEGRREKSARALLSGDPDSARIFEREEVITILPGKRHVTMNEFLRKAFYSHKQKICIVENGFDVPKGEMLAREGICQFVHPQTLQRFGCYSPEDFVDAISRIVANMKRAAAEGARFWGHDALHVPTLVDFATLKAAFIERTCLVSEKDVLDKETRRAWTALRWTVQQFAGLCTGQPMYRNGRISYHGAESMHILLGQSNVAEAWTDGSSYIAFNERVVQRLRSDPLKTAGYILSLTMHEVAHQGDSMDCGHDEAFYQRYHDICMRHAGELQRYIHMWLMKYTRSMEDEGKGPSGYAWSEQRLRERVGSGRQKRGLPGVIEDVSGDPVVAGEPPAENLSFIALQNTKLVESGLCPPPPNWSEVLDRAQQARAEIAEKERQRAAERLALEEAWQTEIRENEEAYEKELQDARARYATLLGIEPSAIGDDALEYIFQTTNDDESVRLAWESKDWERSYEDDYASYEEDVAAMAAEEEKNLHDPNCLGLNAEHRALVRDGETRWMLERNAAAAGFYRVEPYLKWRAGEEADSGSSTI